jgi:hypothetical protein
MLRGTSIYIEISSATAPYMAHANFRQALIEDIKPLVDLGVQFSVSTDHHSVANASKSFHPETYCDPLGITPRNTNTIARELLALRARRSLAPATR